MKPKPTPPWPPVRRRVYLMRHGEVDYFDAQGRAVDPHHVTLNDLGKRQAAAVGSALSNVPFDLAITSGLPRTEETARLVLAGRAVSITQEPRLREIEVAQLTDFAVTGSILGALGAAPSPEARFFGGETFGSCSARAVAAWSDSIARKDWQTVLVVCHGIVNRLLLCHLLEAPMSSLGRIEQDAGCVNLIEVDAAGLPLVRIVNASVDDPAKETHTLSTLEALFHQYLRGRLDPGPRG